MCAGVGRLAGAQRGQLAGQEVVPEPRGGAGASGTSGGRDHRCWSLMEVQGASVSQDHSPWSSDVRPQLKLQTPDFRNGPRVPSPRCGMQVLEV